MIGASEVIGRLRGHRLRPTVDILAIEVIEIGEGLVLVTETLNDTAVKSDIIEAIASQVMTVAKAPTMKLCELAIEVKDVMIRPILAPRGMIIMTSETEMIILKGEAINETISKEGRVENTLIETTPKTTIIANRETSKVTSDHDCQIEVAVGEEVKISLMIGHLPPSKLLPQNLTSFPAEDEAAVVEEVEVKTAGVNRKAHPKTATSLAKIQDSKAATEEEGKVEVVEVSNPTQPFRRMWTLLTKMTLV